jgi:hypothetical protein
LPGISIPTGGGLISDPEQPIISYPAIPVVKADPPAGGGTGSAGDNGVCIVESPHVRTIQQQAGVGGDIRSPASFSSSSSTTGLLLDSHLNRQYGSFIQHQSQSSIEESIPQSSEITAVCKGEQFAIASIPHSRRGEYGDGLVEPSGDFGRLPVKPGNFRESPPKIQYKHRHRPLFIKDKSSDPSVLFSESDKVRRPRNGKNRKRSPCSMDGYDSFDSSSDSVVVEISRKVRRRGEHGSSCSPRLERTSVESTVKEIIDSEISRRESEVSADEGTVNEKEKFVSTAGESSIALIGHGENQEYKLDVPGQYLKGSNDEQNEQIIAHILKWIRKMDNKRKRGEALFSLLALASGLKSNIVKGLMEGLANSTLKNYKVGWNKFVDFLVEEEGHEKSFNNQEGIIAMYRELIDWLSLEENCASSEVRLFSCAVSFLLETIFNVKVQDNKSVALLRKKFSREHPQQPKFITVWDAGILIDYFRNFSRRFTEEEDEDKKFMKFLQGKVGLLLMFFGLLRPNEVLNLQPKDWQIEKDGIGFLTVNKSYQTQKVYVFIPRISMKAICPCTAMELLRDSNKKVWEECPFLFADIVKKIQLSRDNFRNRCLEQMQAAGIDTVKYSIYTTKKAAVEFLVRNKVAVEEINRAMHYKEKNTIAHNYAIQESAKQCAKLLAEATVNRKDDRSNLYLNIQLRKKSKKKGNQEIKKEEKGKGEVTVIPTSSITEGKGVETEGGSPSVPVAQAKSLKFKVPLRPKEPPDTLTRIGNVRAKAIAALPKGRSEESDPDLSSDWDLFN